MSRTSAFEGCFCLHAHPASWRLLATRKQPLLAAKGMGHLHLPCARRMGPPWGPTAERCHVQVSKNNNRYFRSTATPSQTTLQLMQEVGAGHREVGSRGEVGGGMCVWYVRTVCTSGFGGLKTLAVGLRARAYSWLWGAWHRARACSWLLGAWHWARARAQGGGQPVLRC